MCSVGHLHKESQIGLLKISSLGSQAVNLSSDFLCNPNRFGWIPSFSRSTNILRFLHLPRSDLSYLAGQAPGNPVSKLPCWFFQGALLAPCAVLSLSVMSESLWPHGVDPPSSAVHGDSPGKNAGVDCHACSPLQWVAMHPPQCGSPGFDPWVGKITWRRERLPTPVSLPKDCRQNDGTEFTDIGSISSFQLHSRVCLWSRGLQHIRLPCASPTPGACSGSCPLSRWCQATISSCRPLLLRQSFPVSESFPVSQFFPSGGQSIGVSASV